MDSIHIICDTCGQYIENEYTMEYTTTTPTPIEYTTPIEYDDNHIKYIIESNYLIHIEVCRHYNERLIKLIRDLNIDKFWIIDDKSFSIYNDNYLKIYGKFHVRRNNSTKLLKFKYINFNILEKKYKYIEEDEFINMIKKGTIINVIESEDVIFKLEKILLEHNTGFILDKIQKAGYKVYVINTPTFTKSSIKQKLNIIS